MSTRVILPADLEGGRRAGASARRDGAVDLCIANPWFYPVLVGPGERFRRYAPGLRERGVRIRVLTVQGPGLAPREQLDGIEVTRLPIKRKVRWRERTFIYRVMHRLVLGRGRPDVFQVFSPSWIAPLILGLRLFGIPTLLVFTLLGQGRGSRLRRFAAGLYRRALLSCFDRIVTSSAVMTRELEKLGVRAQRIVTIPNGVDTERFRPLDSVSERVRLRVRLGLGLDGEVVVFVGGIMPRKGVDILVEAWHRVARQRPNAYLVLVGPRSDDQAKYVPYQKRVDRLVEAAPDPGRIVFTGAVPNVEDYLRAANLFVFPSAREGMPNVVPEAMACGLPCVVTPFKGLPDEFGEPGLHYALADRTPAALAESMLTLLSDPGRRTRLGEAARLWVERNLDLEDSLDRFAALYRELAGTE